MTEATRQLIIDGVSIEMDARDAQVIERAFSALEDAAKKERERAEEAEEEAESASEEASKRKAECDNQTAVLATKDAEIVSLKKQLSDATSPALFDAAIVARTSVIDRAKKILGDKADFTGKSDAAIRRMAVDSRVGEKAKDWSDSQIVAAFDSIDVGAKGNDPIKDAATAFSRPHFSADNTTSVKDTAYKESVERINNAWRGSAV